MDKNRKKKLLIMTILIIAFVQMPQNAMGPVIHKIVESVFPDRSLAEVQTAFSFSNFVAPVVALVAAYLINRGILTKKFALCTGLTLLGLCAVSIVSMHAYFWQLYIASILLGMATGLFVSNNFGLLFDNFGNAERQVITGYHTSCVNLGGILLSLIGGVLGSLIWYGGFMLFFVGFPIAVLAFFTVPSYRAPVTGEDTNKKERTRLDPRVFYYCGIVFFFMMFYAAGGSNISTHIGSGMKDATIFGRQVSTTALSGAATAIQMTGGVASGFLFSKLSTKLRDYVIVLAVCLVFVGYMMLSFFAHSVPATFIAVFIVGMSLSLTVPRCIFAVSTLVNAGNSATATSLITSLAPSLGAFLSPIIITNLTIALGGESTVFRYRFVGIVALFLAVAVTIVTAVQNRKGKALKA